MEQRKGRNLKTQIQNKLGLKPLGGNDVEIVE